MADVFISYRNTPERRAIVSRLATLLRAHELSVWWDYGLEAGASFTAQIEAEIAKAGIVAPLWCTESIVSEWVQKEAELGKDKLLPVRLQKVTPPDDFALIQAADLIGWDGRVSSPRLQAFVRSVCKRVNRSGIAPIDTLEQLETLPAIQPLPDIAPAPINPLPQHDHVFWERQWEKHGKGTNLILLRAIADDAPRIFAEQARTRIEEVERAQAEAALLQRYRNEGRIQIAAPIVHGAPDGWFKPGGGKEEWFQDADTAPEMVVVPAGRFMMGSPDNEVGRRPDEGPRREVHIESPFAVSRFAVTNAQWDAAVAAGAVQRAGNRPYLIGVTGQRRVGKSTVSGMLEALGVPVIDADEVANALINRPGPSQQAVLDRFGPYLANPDGSLSHGALDIVVSKNPVARQDLETILFNATVTDIRRKIASSSSPIVAVIVPRLFEGGWKRQFDETWAIYCDERELFERAQADGIKAEQLRAMMETELSQDEKVELCGYVIDNTYSLDETRQMVEVTLAEASRRAAERDPAPWQSPEKPATCVSWDDATAYVSWLSKITGQSYRLLLDEEWEYCCRAGTTTRYSVGDTIKESDAEFYDPARSPRYFGPQAGGHCSPNPWGLHDMHGNVQEWCQDVIWDANHTGVGERKSKRVARGGAWCDPAEDLRSAARQLHPSGTRSGRIGFRVAREIEDG